MDSYLNPCTDVLCAVRSFIHRHWRALYIFTNPILILSPRSVTASVFHEYLLFWIILSFCSSHTPITTRSGHLLEQKPLQITNTHQQSRSSKQRRCARHQITSTWAWLCMQAASDRWRDYVMLSSCDDMSKLSTLLLSVSLYSLFFFFHFNSHQAHRVMSQEDFRKASSAETFSTADTNKGWWCWDV